MLAVMVAPVANVEIDFQFVVTLIAVVIISSFGVAGVGGGATFASILVLSTLNLPVALAGVLISIEPLIDMGRTALNVNDSMLAGTGTARLTNHWDKKHLTQMITAIYLQIKCKISCYWSLRYTIIKRAEQNLCLKYRPTQPETCISVSGSFYL